MVMENWDYRVFKQSTDLMDTYTIRECLYLDGQPHNFTPSGSPIVGISSLDVIKDLLMQFEALEKPVLVLNDKGEIMNIEKAPSKSLDDFTRLKDFKDRCKTYVPDKLKQEKCSHTHTWMELCVNCGHDLKGE